MAATPPEDKSKRAVRSFVMRGGRMTAGQSTALEQHWPNYGLQHADGAFDQNAVFGRRAALTLEIGFGMGDSLVAMAEAAPERDFIGIEVHPPGVGRLLAAVHEKQLANLRVFKTDAVPILRDCIGDAQLDTVQLFFPDPWHKKKHHKRRLVQLPLLYVLHRKIKPGGCLHIATDWEPYAEHCLELLEASAGWENRAGKNNYSQRPATRPITKFERRGQRLGHGVWDLLYSRASTTSPAHADA